MMANWSMLIRSILIVTLLLLFGAGASGATEFDDATVFVEAFNAFQKKDYLLAIEKADLLGQLFPDSPLRDVSLLLIARSSLRSGDNERAAKSITTFNREFSESSLRSSVEEELFSLSARQQKGEVLPPNKQLLAAAQKVRVERIEQERIAALKLEQERLAREAAERERIVRAKLEAERREKERLAAEKAARESIKVAIAVRDSSVTIAAGDKGSFPIEISNRGKNSEEFQLEVAAPTEYGAYVASAGNSDKAVTRIKLAAGETFKGKAMLKMPADKVDGHRSGVVVKAISSKYNDIVQEKNVLAITSAPLVRVVAKLARQKVFPGEKLPYRVTVLNIGSLAAKELTIRMKLPPQLDFQGAPDLKVRQDPDGAVVCTLEPIETGKLKELVLDVQVRESSVVGQEIRGQVEVVNEQLQRTETFGGGVAVVQSK